MQIIYSNKAIFCVLKKVSDDYLHGEVNNKNETFQKKKKKKKKKK